MSKREYFGQWQTLISVAPVSHRNQAHREIPQRRFLDGSWATFSAASAKSVGTLNDWLIVGLGFANITLSGLFSSRGFLAALLMWNARFLALIA